MRVKRKPTRVVSQRTAQAGPCKCGGQIVRVRRTTYRAEIRGKVVPVDVMGWTCTKGGDACGEKWSV